MIAQERLLSACNTSQAYVFSCSVGVAPTKSKVETGNLSILFTITFVVQVFPAASTKFIVSLAFELYVFINVLASTFVHHVIVPGISSLVLIVTKTSPFVGAVVE